MYNSYVCMYHIATIINYYVYYVYFICNTRSPVSSLLALEGMTPICRGSCDGLDKLDNVIFSISTGKILLMLINRVHLMCMLTQVTLLIVITGTGYHMTTKIMASIRFTVWHTIWLTRTAC